MSFWLSKKVKKTRKPHTCQYCSCTIPAGSSCTQEGGRYEGDFNHYYLCDRCKLFMNKYVDLGSSHELGNLLDDIHNTGLLDCPKCGSYRHGERDYIENMQMVALECDNCNYSWIVDISLDGLRDYLGQRKE